MLAVLWAETSLSGTCPSLAGVGVHTVGMVPRVAVPAHALCFTHVVSLQYL